LQPRLYQSFPALWHRVTRLDRRPPVGLELDTIVATINELTP
jgi:hypothetical protein